MPEMMTPKDKAKRLQLALTKRTEAFAQQWPVGAPDRVIPRFIRSVVTACMETPALLDCNPADVVKEAMIAARMGLEVGRTMKQAALVPFKGKPQLIVQYEGMAHIAWAANEIQITAEPVYERDKFEYWEDETGSHMRHVPTFADDPGPLLCAWARFRFKDGTTKFRVVPGRRIRAIKAQQIGKSKKPSPWSDPVAEPEMWMKTAVRAGFKLLPKDFPAVRAMNAALAREDGEEVVLDADVEDITAAAEEATTAAEAKPSTLDQAAEKLAAEDQAAAEEPAAEAKVDPIAERIARKPDDLSGLTTIKGQLSRTEWEELSEEKRKKDGHATGDLVAAVANVCAELDWTLDEFSARLFSLYPGVARACFEPWQFSAPMLREGIKRASAELKKKTKATTSK